MAQLELYTEADKLKLSKFTKILTHKVAQIVVQSRQGKKITQEINARNPIDNGPPSPNNQQWFNLSIPDEPEVKQDTNGVLKEEIVSALSKVLCIEISLRTSDDEGMVLELWTVRMVPSSSNNGISIPTIYYRMSIMLKSTLTISRITPAYKMSRSQHKESYKIFHKIYGGEPNLNLLGEQFKSIKISDLQTPIGTIYIDVVYRTKMTILPEDKPKIALSSTVTTTVNDIMVKSDHFYESPKKVNDKKEIDLSKPLTAGAFVDADQIRELHDALSQQLPPEPQMSWLRTENDNKQNLQKMKNLTISENENDSKPSCSADTGTSTLHATSKAIEVPKMKNGDKYSSLMDFPFADGSPMAELANFYQECLQARSASDEWTDIAGEASASTDSESLSQQLKMFEDAVPEFDNMVASMFSNSENGSE
ncbi:autophagy-related protein 13 homolog [Achroia grisella]|uniref:autophagy-related protein 13 homolog n=1 Tax=Achroia grisella TaxID=688607 RepID=UPI0027D2B229|nr:autophagy-related protein 13 homolog [Achroia grisella]